MKLIEDLGCRECGSQGWKKRYGLYECPVCHEHFECRVGSVKSGNTTKCNSCARKAIAKSRAAKAASEFIEKAWDIHGDLYEYLLDDYTNNSTKIKITCAVHGVFNQTPHSHLSGRGCPECARISVAEGSALKAASEFIEKARNIHGDLYEYLLVDYVNSYTKVKIACQIHGVFDQTPNNHLCGKGCPECAKERSDIALRMSEKNNRPTTLYYIYFPEVNLWKVGCTSKTIEERFSREALEYIIIKTKEYTSGNEAYRVEKVILDATKEYKFNGKVLGSGNTELRTQTIDTIVQSVV